jgi:hypothetical protein
MSFPRITWLLRFIAPVEAAAWPFGQAASRISVSLWREIMLGFEWGQLNRI